jgi:ABC-type nitrate/sulfonate/bicarbonate transport system, ATPase component
MTMAMAEAETQKGFIDVRNMGVTFGANDNKVVAVENVSLNVQPGEFVSLIGPSGCGKSTLLSIVAGFVKPTLGEAKLDGKAITRPGSDRGVVFQQYSLFPWLSVRKNVEFGLKMAGVEQSKRNTTARAARSRRAALVREPLSGPALRRHEAAHRHRPRAGDSPQVLLMDEPFGALDTQTRVVMQEILTNIWQQFKISVLFITHDIEESIFLSDRIYVMTARPGRIKAEIKVPLPRPRRAEMTDTPEFMNLVQELKGLIREESLAPWLPRSRIEAFQALE